MELGLPWANRQRRTVRIFFRVVLVAAVAFPFLFYYRGPEQQSRWKPWYRSIGNFMEGVFINIVHFMAPGIVSLAALWTGTRCWRSSCCTESNPSGGDDRDQVP